MVVLRWRDDIGHGYISWLCSLDMALLGSLELPPQLLRRELVLIEMIHVGDHIWWSCEWRGTGDRA